MLYKMCSRHALLPRNMQIVVSYDRTGIPFRKGGFADVWKGKHDDRDVAVKVITIYQNSDVRRRIGVSFLVFSPFACRYTDGILELLQGGFDVEDPSASKCPAAHRSDHVRETVRDDIRLYGTRKYQRLRQGTSRCEPGQDCRLCFSSLALVFSLTTANTPAGRCF